jgi:putative hydrolase of the HAD superfamily
MSDSGPPRGLLVDWGGVLTTDVFAAFELFCAREGLSTDAVRQAFRATPAAREALIALETGVYGEPEFAVAIAPVLGVDPESLVDRMMAGTAEDPAMMGLVERAHSAGIATGLVSNSWGLHRYDRIALGKIFDALVISGELGVRKPAPEIYRRGAAAIGLDPAECVFVDDIAGNLGPARDLGMRTVLHVSAESTIAALSDMFGVDLAV